MEARRASLSAAWFLGAVGLQPRCSWRAKLLPGKAVLPAARCVGEPARRTCVCLRVFCVCVRDRESDREYENVNEKSFLCRVQATLENAHKGTGCDLLLGTSVFETLPGGCRVQPGWSTALPDPLPWPSHTCSFVSSRRAMLRCQQCCS